MAVFISKLNYLNYSSSLQLMYQKFLNDNLLVQMTDS